MPRTCSSSASGRSRPTPGARAASTGPQDVYTLDPLVRLSLDALVGARYAPAPGAFDWVRQELLDPQDPWLVVADLGSYLHRQDEALAEFADPRAFTEKAILTLARARRFWVDRLELEP